MTDNEEPKKIKVVSGDGTDLDISPVYDHVNVNRNQDKPKNIVVPKVNRDSKENKDNNNDETK